MANPKIGERWMFHGAKTDFTIVVIHEGRIYYHVNRPEKEVDYDDIASMYSKTYKTILPSLCWGSFLSIASRSTIK